MTEKFTTKEKREEDLIAMFEGCTCERCKELRWFYNRGRKDVKEQTEYELKQKDYRKEK